MSTYSPAQIADAAYNAGFRGESLTTAVAVALAESGGDLRAHNATPPDNSYGLWQINMLGALEAERHRQFDITTNSALYLSGVNARAARSVWKEAGGSFSPWSTYTGGAYRSHLSAASAAASTAMATKGHAAGGESGRDTGSGKGSASGKGSGSGRGSGSGKTSRSAGGCTTGDRVVVDLGELRTIATRLDGHHDVLMKLAAQARHRTLDLDLAGLAAGGSRGWAVTDPAHAAPVVADLDGATTGRRSATSAARDLLDTAAWVGRFREKMLAADGTDGRGSGAKPVSGTGRPGDGGGRRGGGDGKPAKPAHPSSPGVSRTAKIEQVLDVGRANLATRTGITDGGRNDTKYGAWYGNNGQPWCAQFVSYTFHKAGYDLPHIDGPNGFQSVPNANRYLAAKGLLHSTPKVGDVFLYRDGHHTGIVSKVFLDGTIGTIEGNAGNATDRVVDGHRTDISAMRFWSPIR